MTSSLFDTPRLLNGYQARWNQLTSVERGPLLEQLLNLSGAHLPGGVGASRHGLDWMLGMGPHMEAVERALRESAPLTVKLLRAQLKGFDVATLWPIVSEMLWDVCKYVGGGAALGFVIGGPYGLKIGSEIGLGIYNAVGLKDLLHDLPVMIEQVVGPYRRGFASAWSLAQIGDRDVIQHLLLAAQASREFAAGHALLLVALLAAIAMHLARKAGRRLPLFAALAEGKLGPRFADWIQRHQAQLMELAKRERPKTLAEQLREAEERPRLSGGSRQGDSQSGTSKSDAKTRQETPAKQPPFEQEPHEPVSSGRLPGAERALIDPRKLSEYALNPDHPVGGNKARVFESVLGFNAGNADELMGQLRRGVVQHSAIAGKVDQFGSRFTMDIPVTGPKGTGTVRTGWIYKPGSETPELTTLYVK